MISVERASELIAQSIPLQPIEQLAVADSAGQVLAEAVVAERDQPPFDRVMMDGIAVDSSNRSGDYQLQATIAAAGAPRQQLESTDHCLEAMTGAPLPQGTDCVVPVEQIERQGQQVRVGPAAQIESAKFVHSQGSDHRQGATLLTPGQLIRAPEIAVLVSAGKALVETFRRPSVAVIASGDELVDVDQVCAPHQIRRSNDYAIEAMLRTRGWLTIERDHVPDQRDQVRARLAAQLERHDALVLTGGVSMGKFDYLPGVLAELGVEVIFHRVTQRPGKPMWFGRSAAGKPVFALPGNPVSAMVCCRRYVVPALQAMSGQSMSGQKQPGHWLGLAEAIEFAPALSYFLPIVCNSAGHAVPHPTNTSGDFASLTSTDGFVELPAKETHFASGYQARYYPW